MATIVTIINAIDGKETGEHWAAIEGDVFKAQSGALHEENGWHRAKMTPADFAEWIKVRAYRLRINVLNGEYQYEN